MKQLLLQPRTQRDHCIKAHSIVLKLVCVYCKLHAKILPLIFRCGHEVILFWIIITAIIFSTVILSATFVCQNIAQSVFNPQDPQFNRSFFSNSQEHQQICATNSFLIVASLTSVFTQFALVMTLLFNGTNDKLKDISMTTRIWYCFGSIVSHMLLWFCYDAVSWFPMQWPMLCLFFIPSGCMIAFGIVRLTAVICEPYSFSQSKNIYSSSQSLFPSIVEPVAIPVVFFPRAINEANQFHDSFDQHTTTVIYEKTLDAIHEFIYRTYKLRVRLFFMDGHNSYIQLTSNEFFKALTISYPLKIAFVEDA